MSTALVITLILVAINVGLYLGIRREGREARRRLRQLTVPPPPRPTLDLSRYLYPSPGEEQVLPAADPVDGKHGGREPAHPPNP